MAKTKAELKKELKKLKIEAPKDASNKDLQKLIDGAEDKEETKKEDKEEDKKEDKKDKEETKDSAKGDGEPAPPSTDKSPTKSSETTKTEEDSKGKIEDLKKAQNDEEKEIARIKLRSSGYSSKGKGPVDIINGNRYIRTYSEEAHGKDFVKMAENFCKKKAITTKEGKKVTAFKMVNSEAVGRVYVSYKHTAKKSGIISQKKDEFPGTVEGKEKALARAAYYISVVTIE